MKQLPIKYRTLATELGYIISLNFIKLMSDPTNQGKNFTWDWLLSEGTKKYVTSGIFLHFSPQIYNKYQKEIKHYALKSTNKVINTIREIRKNT